MDRKRYEMRNLFLIVFSLLSFIVLFFLLNNFFNNDSKQQITKSISLNNCQLTIKLDNTNSKKRIGSIKDLHLNYVVGLGIQTINKTESEITLCNDIETVMDCFYDNEECVFTVSWFGGNLKIRTLYKNGQFEILDEYYANGI